MIASEEKRHARKHSTTGFTFLHLPSFLGGGSSSSPKNKSGKRASGTTSATSAPADFEETVMYLIYETEPKMNAQDILVQYASRFEFMFQRRSKTMDDMLTNFQV